MAKITPRRRVALDNPEEVYTLAQRLLAPVKPYTTWLMLAGMEITGENERQLTFTGHGLRSWALVRHLAAAHSGDGSR